MCTIVFDLQMQSVIQFALLNWCLININTLLGVRRSTIYDDDGRLSI